MDVYNYALQRKKSKKTTRNGETTAPKQSYACWNNSLVEGLKKQFTVL